MTMKKLIAILLLTFTVGLGFAAKANYSVEKYNLLDQQQQYQEIINDITQKDESEFTTSDYFYLGLANFRLEKDEEALKYFTIVTQNDPSFSSSYYYIGGIYLYSREYDKAIPYYEKCIELDDKDAQSYEWLGTIYETLGDYQKALEYFSKFYSLDKKNPDALYHMAYTLYVLNDLGKAKTYAENYLKQDKTSYAMNSIMIMCLYSKGDYKKAQKYENQLIEIWKNSQEDYIKEQSYFKLYSFSYNGYDLSVYKKLDQTEIFYDLLVCNVYKDGTLIKTVNLEYDGLTVQILGGAAYFIGTFDIESRVHSTASIAYEKCPDFPEFIKCVKLAVDGKLEISASSIRK